MHLPPLPFIDRLHIPVMGELAFLFLVCQRTFPQQFPFHKDIPHQRHHKEVYHDQPRRKEKADSLHLFLTAVTAIHEQHGCHGEQRHYAEFPPFLMGKFAVTVFVFPYPAEHEKQENPDHFCR